ncbi:hypothetical protein [uncultured Altibacter sp.]|uniref:hypothetical protein n=1 Tax=uncultured Altibacter sp. TaxID=2506933 RepID=UPI0030DA76BB
MTAIQAGGASVFERFSAISLYKFIVGHALKIVKVRFRFGRGAFFYGCFGKNFSRETLQKNSLSEEITFRKTVT